MAQPVLALGCALVTGAGCVWYLPALADLRAGAADRPPSRRTAAFACLTGWGTVAAVGLTLLVTASWWAPCAVTAAGGTAVAVLRVRAALRRAGERRETARLWAAWPPAARCRRAPSGAGRSPPWPSPSRSRWRRRSWFRLRA
ncbi:hypothetical protein LUX09_10710 [Streptomyces albogriseolus]|nr:hypothetical protein [Streptomyces albogriseolus]